MEDLKIDYLVHEGFMVRQERTIKRLWILCIIIFLALVGTNIGWLWYESQFEDHVITQDILQDSGTGDNNYNGKIIGGDFYGEATDQNNGENPET